MKKKKKKKKDTIVREGRGSPLAGSIKGCFPTIVSLSLSLSLSPAWSSAASRSPSRHWAPSQERRKDGDNHSAMQIPENLNDIRMGILLCSDDRGASLS